MYLYGGSGHAKVIRDIIEVLGYQLEGVIDDNPELNEFMGMPVMHVVDDRVKQMIISIGANHIRRMIAERYEGRVEYPSAVHPSVVKSPYASVGEGTVVMQGAVLQSCVKVGRHCIINSGASVDHDGCIGDYAHIAPGVTLCGNVSVGEGTLIGVGSVAIPGVNVGKWSIVGAGSVIVHDIPDGVLAFGNPCCVIKKL